MNGDGYGDVIVGAFGLDSGQVDEGGAFVYHGSASGIVNIVMSQLETNVANAYGGCSVAGAGDVNGDGYSDVILGAYQYTAGELKEGAALIYLGSTGVNSTPQRVLQSDQIEAYFGWRVSSAGDVNGDGYADIVIGSYYYDNGEINEGVAFIYHGSSSGISGTYSALLECNQAYAVMGISVSCAGDVNSDGYSDVLVGAYGYDNGSFNEGAAFVFYGSYNGVINAIQTSHEPNLNSAYSAYSVAGLGDVNGDGYSDIGSGVYNYSNGQDSEGCVLVFLGNEAGITTKNTTAQTKPGTNDKLPTLGLTGSNGSARLSYFSKSPQGVQKGRLILEVKPVNSVFGGGFVLGRYTGNTFRSPSLSALSGTGSTLVATVNSLAQSGTKWRARLEYDKVTSLSGQTFGPWHYYAVPGREQQAFKARSGPLPVKYLSLVAHFDRTTKEGIVSWVTASEEANAYFIVQSSRDGSTWADLGHVEGNGTTQSRHEYEFKDNTIQPGITYYRLEQVDTDGDREKSKVVQVLWKEELGVNIMQNPVQDVLRFTISNEATFPVNYTLVNANGEVIRTSSTTNGNIIENVSTLPAGTYYLFFKDAKGVESSEKVVVVH